MADVSQFLVALKPMFAEHLRTYLATNGEEGYIFDASPHGGSPVTTTLILKTIGRKSGRTLLVPLIYSAWGDEYIVIASKGGADENPAWFTNLIARPDICFQVRNKKFRGTWRVAEGKERAQIWDYVTRYFPPYAQYQAITERTIPAVVLTVTEQIDEVWTPPE